jgi:hypothetical protein
MIAFDRLLVDPLAADLADAVAAGAIAVRKVGSFIDWPPVNLPTVLAEARDQERGSVLWQPQGHSDRPFLRLDWAIDHRGRRLVRVNGGMDWYDNREFSLSPQFTRWPPLARVYGEASVVFRSEDGEPEVLVACPCGVLGTPTDIAWMDDRCGPCHDRTVDGVPLPEPFLRHRRLFGQGAMPPHGLPRTLTADGRGVLLASRLRHTPLLSRNDFPPIVVCVDTGELHCMLPVSEGLHTAAFSADGQRLALLSEHAGQSRLHVLNWPGLQPVAPLDLPGWARCLALSPDGSTAYVRTDEVPLSRIALNGSRQPEALLPGLPTYRPESLATSPDGTWLAARTNIGTVALFDVRQNSFQRLAHCPTSSGHVAFHPNSQYLWGVELDGTVWVCEVPSLRQLGQFQALGPGATGLVLSPPWLVVLAFGDQPSIFWPLQPLLDFAERRA